ncbi:MAG: isocitrate/isopropylmalate family dehydrogenase, partial [Desulfobacterales bacterium]|nr:isocitrate/isopropylmalate family dehydrogenase [Desulfobacterales bacterium]
MAASPIVIDESGTLVVPDEVVIPYITGDGIGKDIWPAARTVMDAAIKAEFGGEKSIEWLEVEAGNDCFEATGDGLPEASIQTIADHHVAIKGPMSTPVGKGMRSLNVRLRQTLDLFACIRPVAYYPPVPSPVKYPEKTDIVVFRENTEDLYAGIEWDSGSDEAKKLIHIFNSEMGCNLSETCSLGLKPMSPEGSKRLIASAITYALENNRKSVTLMHKGNIMKFTEGGFREWGYELAQDAFPDQVITEAQLWD